MADIDRIVESSISRVLKDLQDTTGNLIEPTIGVEHSGHDWVNVRFKYERGDIATALETGQSEESITVDVALWLQDSIRDDLRESWPKCPNHEHSLTPVLQEGHAKWQCPHDPAVNALIGNLSKGFV